MRTDSIKVLLSCAVMVMSGVATGAETRVARPKVTVTWLGHAAFEVVSPGGTRILIDPWLRENARAPKAWKTLEALADHVPAAILVTHSHRDHASDVAEIASRTHAPVITAGELLRWLHIPEPQQRAIDIGGGALRIGDVEIFGVPAMHSSEPGGRPMGFVLRFEGGRTLYHSGDTFLFGDMQLIEELYHPEILLLEAGGACYGLNPATAALAVRRYFHPKVIVPMHFGTDEDADQESAVRAAFAGDRRLHVLTPGEPTEF